MRERVLKIGTRGSALALEQAARVKAGIGGPTEIAVVTTSGDRFTEEPLGERNPVGFFTKEIEDELLRGGIDLAVHSLKDLPTQLAPGLSFGAILERDVPSVILLVRPSALNASAGIPVAPGGILGASSRRRQALIRFFRPDIEVRPLRGNVPTRVEKLKRGDYDAILLSRAGLERLRLGVSPLVPYELNPLRWPVAPGQAVIAVEVRTGDEEVLDRVAALDHPDTRMRVQAERSLLTAFGGGCHAPFGAFGTLESGEGLIVVGAPGGKDGFLVEHFRDRTIERAKDAAEKWIRSGCPERGIREVEGWLCRPARPWC